MEDAHRSGPIEPPVADVIHLRADVAWQNLDGEVVALDLASATYVMANDTGAILWPLVVDGATEIQLAEALTARFSIEPERARADVAEFVGQLRTLALVDQPG